MMNSCAISLETRLIFGELNESIGRNLLNNLTSFGCNCSTIVSINQLGEHLYCEPFPVSHAWWIELSYVLLFGAIILLSVGGNLTVIWIVLRHRRMRTVTNYFLVSYCNSDISIHFSVKSCYCRC
jgi:hypothetical protein